MSIDAADKEGLTATVAKAIRAALVDIWPVWIAEPLVDRRRMLRPQGLGGFSIDIEPHRGFRTFINLHKRLEACEPLRNLESVIRESQPELLGYLVFPGGFQLIQDAYSLLVAWLQQVQVDVDNGTALPDAIERLLAELGDLLRSGAAVYEVFTPLAGLLLADDVESIQLESNVLLRRLSVDEISAIASNHVHADSTDSLILHSISTAVVVTQPVPFVLTVAPPVDALNQDVLQLTREKLDNVIACLHILKSGRVGIVASHTRLNPLILPGMQGPTSRPLVANRFGSLALTTEDISALCDTYAAMAGVIRSEVRIAAGRLVDAESRWSPVDSLLDAAIGLEVLLNPVDRGELSFRVAMNFAYLATEAARRRRFETVKVIQETRNRVVHGGLNLRSKDASVIQDHAVIAKECLRDALQRFFSDATLTGSGKLDAAFWLDRMIPPNSGA